MDTVSPLLISRLREKKKLLEENNNQHKKIKTALVVDGAAMQGVYAASVLSALKELGLEQVFDIVSAVSSGAISVSYFLSGQADIAPEVFYEGFASKKFINLYTFHPSKIAGIDYAYEVLAKIKPLDKQAILHSRSQYYIGVTDPETGKGKYLDITKGTIDVGNALHASSAIPMLNNNPVLINKKDYIDGMIGCGIPIEIPLQQGCTDILVIENVPLGKLYQPNAILLKTIFRLFKFEATPEVKKAIHNKKKRWQETLEEIYDAQKQGINIGIIAPKKITVNQFSINSKFLKQTADEAKKQTLQIFS